MAEEIGWRGFALPRLLEHFGSLWASILLGLGWSLWHRPMFFMDGSVQAGTSFMIFTVGSILWSIMMTAIYHRTGGSALVFHMGINVAFYTVSAPDAATPYVAVLLILTTLLAVWALPRPLITRERHQSAA